MGRFGTQARLAKAGGLFLCAWIRGVLAELTAHKHKLGKKVDPKLLAAAM